MNSLDWVVLVCTLAGVVGFGLYKSRNSRTVDQYLLAGRTMPWYAMGLSIIATQASAVTFISTTGQGYVDGLRFVQFYFGLPIAMVMIAAIAVPIYRRANVYTAYEYLERRFDRKTRALASVIFLLQRGLSVGVALYAPAIVLSLILGLNDGVTTLLIGLLVIVYTASGGIPAVTWTDVLQMAIISFGLIAALVMVLHLLPAGVSLFDALYLAGALHRTQAIDPHFDLNNRYTLWSGLIGGAFLSLSYFGCDQSQVQRYLTGRSVAQSRLSLLFTGLVKIPMQFFILFTGAMVFVFFLFIKPPLTFDPAEQARVQSSFAFDQAFESRRAAALEFNRARHAHDPLAQAGARSQLNRAQQELDASRKAPFGAKSPADTNYIFLSFVTHYLPHGLVGLIIAVIFSAAMSSSSGEVNSLATVTVIDLYRRYFRTGGSDRHYLWASRLATVFWGLWAIGFARYVRHLGSLIEAVNLVGSLFYGTLLGVFTLAFFFRRVGGTAAFWGMIAGEAAILASAKFTGISFLWYNVIGALVVIVTALLLSRTIAPAPIGEAT